MHLNLILEAPKCMILVVLPTAVTWFAWSLLCTKGEYFILRAGLMLSTVLTDALKTSGIKRIINFKLISLPGLLREIIPWKTLQKGILPVCLEKLKPSSLSSSFNRTRLSAEPYKIMLRQISYFIPLYPMCKILHRMSWFFHFKSLTGLLAKSF